MAVTALSASDAPVSATLASSTVVTSTNPWKHLWMMLLPGFDVPPSP